MANKILSATFTPAASSHNGGDCVGAAQRFVLASHVAGQSWIIKNSSLRVDNATAEASAFTLHLYSVTPPSAIADDAAFDITAADRSVYLGSLALGTLADIGTTQYIEVQTHNKTIRLPSDATGLWGYLVITTTTTLTASAHVVSLAVEMAK